MALSDSITKMRRFLRDPDGLIWTDADLLAWWNEAQIEIAQKTGLLKKVEAHYYPPRYTYAYTYNWEKGGLEGDTYKAFLDDQSSGAVMSYPWEASYFLDGEQTPDDGNRGTQPWENQYGAWADCPPVLLHANLYKMNYCAWDQERIDPISQGELSESDPYYRTRTGQVLNYWRTDGEEGNSICLYPQPETIVWEEGTDPFFDTESYLTTSEYGPALEVINAENALFMVYDSLPAALTATTDTPDFPAWAIRVIEYATLERAFAADTDGFIPSLRDYWKVRKEISLKALRRFQTLRLSDRKFVMGGGQKCQRRRGPSLGAHYPAG